MRVLANLRQDRSGSSAAEFALVLPLLLILLFGVIDAGRFLWEYNEAEKATQVGVRFAVVTDPPLQGLSTFSFATSLSDLIPAGNAVPTANFTSATCTSSKCDCVSSTGGFCAATSLNSTALRNLVARMAAIYPPIGQSNVEVDYKNVGLGFAGDPDGPNVSPLVTVKLTGLAFHPITCLVFSCSIPMPKFSATLTGEDLSGSASN
jgi:hypothetical protein